MHTMMPIKQPQQQQTMRATTSQKITASVFIHRSSCSRKPSGSEGPDESVPLPLEMNNRTVIFSKRRFHLKKKGDLRSRTRCNANRSFGRCVQLYVDPTQRKNAASVGAQFNKFGHRHFDSLKQTKRKSRQNENDLSDISCFLKTKTKKNN